MVQNKSMYTCNCGICYMLNKKMVFTFPPFPREFMKTISVVYRSLSCCDIKGNQGTAMTQVEDTLMNNRM